MTVYQCKCSFTSSSATTFHRHLRRFKDEGVQHQMISTSPEHTDEEVKNEEDNITDAGEAKALTSEPRESPIRPGPAESPIRPEPAESPIRPGRSMLERLSFASAIGSLWSSPDPGKSGEHSGLLRGQSPRVALELLRSPQQDEATTNLRADDTVPPESGSPLKSDGDHSGSDWEAVDEDYSDITRALQAAGETPAGDAVGGCWVPSTMTRTFNMIWGGGRPDDAAKLAVAEQVEGELLSTEPMRLSQLLPSLPSQMQVEDLEDIFLWQDPMVSGKVAGAGLYILICLRHLVNGVELIQPSTVLAAAALGLLAFNSAKAAWLRHRHSVVASQQDRRLAEHRLREHTGDILAHTCSAITPLLSACVALIGRRLSGQGSAGARFWLGASLWSIMCIAELGWVSQATLALWLWGSLFTLPTLYTTCRAALDALVEESLAFLLAVLAGGQKGVLLASGSVGLLAFALMDARIFVRLTIAVLSSVSVLLVSAHRLSSLKAAESGAC